VENLSICWPIHPLVHLNKNTVIHKGSCRLEAVCISCDGANGDCDVYDGDNANSRHVLHLEALSGTTFNFEPSHSGAMHYGIYVVVSAATTHVTVVYDPKIC
jgi:hypothetical protein